MDASATVRSGRGRDPRRWVRRRVPAPLRRADLALFRAVAAAPLPRSGPAFRRLSRVADRSKLWLGLATLLAVFGGDRGRRAAAHAVVAVASTSALVNLPAKLLSGRDRPALTDVPELRRIVRVPTSSSFPSGHAAAAAAFATAVGRDLPVLAAPIGALAAAVAASRVVVGAHYPADVLVGAALGATVAARTAPPWAAAPTHPAEVGGPAGPNPLGPRGEGLVLVVNGAAGDDDAEVDRLRLRLPGAEVVAVTDPTTLSATLRQAADRAHVLGVRGGDGSVSAAAGCAAARGVPLLIVPGGTLDHLARDLGLADEATALAAVTDGEVRTIDLLDVDGRPVVNVASLGWYPRLVARREQHEERLGKWPAALLAAVVEVTRGRPLEVELDGRRRRVWLLHLGNGRFASPGLSPRHRVRLEEGVVELRLAGAEAPASRLRLLLALLTGRADRTPVFEQHAAPSVELRTPGADLLARDGEVGPAPTRIEARSRPGGLQVLLPVTRGAR